MNFLELDVGYVVQCFLGSDATNPHLVMQPPQSFLSTMEEYVKDAPRAAPSGTLYLKDVPVSDVTRFLKCWDSSDSFHWNDNIPVLLK
jgi:hypothetical protein